jgi:hypothetical protein
MEDMAVVLADVVADLALVVVTEVVSVVEIEIVVQSLCTK